MRSVFSALVLALDRPDFGMMDLIFSNLDLLEGGDTENRDA
jgi:hypothetical protein